MTAFTVCRIDRISGPRHVLAAVGHNTRTIPTPSADSTRSDKNQTLLAFNDPASSWAAASPWATVQNRIRVAEEKRQAAGLPVRKQRTDAVHAIEVLLSASPEYFRPGRADEWNAYDQDRLDAWRTATWDWLRRTYGDRLIDARLHLDEATPHIQAIVVPLTEDGRLSAREVASGKALMVGLQTSYAQAVKHLGIERGLEGSKAVHERVRDHHKALTRPDPEPPTITLPAPPLTRRGQWSKVNEARINAEIKPAFEEAARPGKRAKRAVQRTAAARETAADMRRFAQQEHQAADQARADARTADAAAEAMATRADVQIKAAQGMAQEAARKAQEALEAQRRDHTARMRDLPLEAVLEAAGWDRDLDDRHQWRGPGEGRVSVKGAKWFDQDAQKGGGKAIDLAKHLTGQDFEGALGWLGRHFGDEPARSALRAKAEDPAPLPQPQPFELPIHHAEAVPQVRAYLTQRRNLPERMIDGLLKAGRLLAESYRGHANAVFVMGDQGRNPVGAERRGVNGPFAGLAPGSSRNEGWFRVVKGSKAPPFASAVVVTEAAIDAISARELIQVPPGERWMFASTAGARPDAPWLRELVKRGSRLVIGFDNDETGESMAAAMMRAYPTQAIRLRPPVGNDWNDTLRARTPELAEEIDQAVRRQLASLQPEAAQDDDDLVQGPSP